MSNNKQAKARLRMKQLVSYTALSESTIRRRIRDGVFPKGYKDGRATVWDIGDIDNYFISLKKEDS